MSSITTGVSCPLPPRTWLGRVSEKLNTSWHKYALWIFGAITLAHWGEHLSQAYQVYVLGWPLPRARGMIGVLAGDTVGGWLVKSEFMHYLYAVVMLAALWVLRKGFTGRSYVWWMIAFWIQFWHHIEHALLQGQVLATSIAGENMNFFGAPQPISVIQMIGFFYGPASGSMNESFGGMLGPNAHGVMTMFIRRVEVHLFYNTIVFVPMAIGMYLHVFPSPEEEQHMGCTCSWHYKKGRPHVVVQGA